MVGMRDSLRPMSDSPTMITAAPGTPAVPEGVRVGNESLVRLTAAAGAKVRQLIAREHQGDLLRIAITGGGCNGLSYKLRFAAEAKRGDILVRSADTSVLVDGKTALYLRGTVLDYSSQLIAGGFKFTNPNAKASCSCGESFSV
jgi:iron-sulfur cluster assembly protein